jgi:hypothetical protein
VPIEEEENTENTDNDLENGDNLQPTTFYENYPEIRASGSNDTVENNSEITVAPGEGKVPTNIMRDDFWDVNSFPLLFPSGRFGLKFKRQFLISCQKYFAQRILNRNNQFVNYPPWLFAAVYYLERHQLEQQININYRKGKFVSDKIIQ